MLQPFQDDELFERSQFKADLALKASPIPAFKKAIKRASEILDSRLQPDCDIVQMVRGRAWFIDQILLEAWAQFDWGNGEQIALVAVGGYGRGELHPHSDIDILLLLDSEEQESLRPQLEGFLTLLWDIGLEIGQSVRSVQECAEEARGDLTIITNLQESRTIAGPDSLRQRMQAATAPDCMWDRETFFRAKKEEQAARHAKYNDTEYNLEPNIKGSRGGLRDFQHIRWVTSRFYGTDNLAALLERDLLTRHEYELLLSGRDFLWKVRWALHSMSPRAEDRLLFECQRRIAPLLGFETSDAKLAVESFMQKYYRVAMAVSEMSDLINQHLEEQLEPAGPAQTRVLNSRFQVRGGFLEVTADNVFRRYPSALLEAFVLLAQNPEIRGVRAHTIRLLRDHRYLIDDDYRKDIRNTTLFVELFRSQQGIHRNLRLMHRIGILSRYLPAFGRITGQMQHDLFHIYTVDAHTLHLLKTLRRLHLPEMTAKLPLAAELMGKLPKPELIYFAALFHDIAKGRGGDHSELGAEDAMDFCMRHHLPPWDCRLVAWMVRNHLLISTTAQRKDLSDPQVIHDFAVAMGDQVHLDYLYTLTVADINATNPTLWNSWRASLMRQLYAETKRALRRGLENPIDREERIRETQHIALQLLRQDGVISQEAAEQLWDQLGDDYFLRHNGGDVAWHTRAILEHPNDGSPLVLLKETTERQFEGGTQIFIYAPDQHDLFAVTVAAMDQLNLNIQDAGILTSTSLFTLDTYVVLDASGGSIGDDCARIAEIRQGLTEALRQPEDYPNIIARRVPRQLKQFNFPPRIVIHNDAQRALTVLEISAPDRPGLLARVGQIFLDFDLSVQNAKISTLGERVEDVFFVTDADNQPLSDPELCQRLQAALVEQLGDNGQPTPTSITF